MISVNGNYPQLNRGLVTQHFLVQTFSMEKKTYYTISLKVDNPNKPLAHDQSKGVGLTADVRLAITKSAHIESRELAEEFLSNCRSIFEKRYGRDGYEAYINKYEGSGRHVIHQIKRDSDIIRARICTSNFAPNKKADLSVLDTM